MGLIIYKGAIQGLEFLILFYSCFCLKFSIAIDTITLTHPITDPESITSGNGTFQLGFFSPANTTNRYVGIWYSKIPVKTVVWVANRDKPLNDSFGAVTISQDGNLIVLNRQKEVIWSSNVSNSVAISSFAQLLDSGNLVLLDNSTASTIWESFQYPSDSFISKMKLRSLGSTLVLKSWRSSSDPSDGGFYFGINPLATPESFIWIGSQPYWRSGPWNGRAFIGVPGMNSYNYNAFNVADNNEGTVDATYINQNESLLIDFVLNHEGILMEKFWNEGKKEWEVNWSAPGNECDVYGKCGPFGSCNRKDSPICSCLKGFKPNHVEEWNNGNFTAGCVRRTPLQCERNGNSSQNQSKQDGFLKLTTMKVPVFAEKAVVLQEECENQCLTNCSCAAYAYYTGIGCMLWSGSLTDVQKFSSHGADLYIRVANSELGKKRNMKVVIAVSIIIGSIIVAICVYFSWMWMFKQRGMKKTEREMVDFSTEITSGDTVNRTKLEELPLFKFKKLAIATDNFNVTNKLGQGGFGPVYKGKLLDGQEIAVKRLSRSSKQGLEEFMNEVVMISKLQHRNLVRLLGCCVEGEENMLIYEYMPNKSLDAFLFDPHKQELLDWHKRLNIIEGIGRGLLYLHRDSRLRIIHRDLKASNILLDKELHPKISDFGMARIFGGNEDQANTTRVVGTYGYMAPEYAMGGRFSEKSDIFSFGVLLLEIVSGRRNNSFYNDEEAWSLLGYAWKLWNEDNIVTLIDTTIYNQDFQKEMLRCIHIGLLCVQELVAYRPTISTILSMLSSEIAHLAKPKQPAFTQQPTSSNTRSSQQSQHRCSMNDVTVTIVEGR